jgi:molecular chaperone HtpG
MDIEKSIPVEGKEDEFDKQIVTETLNSQKAIWMKKSAEITDDEYTEFYKHISHDFEKPFERIHFSVEGTTEFSALLYLPSRMPFDLVMQGDRMRGVQLFVKRVFIMDDAEALMPRWLRFVKGVVDSSDLPLNVSREILQQDRILAKIKSNLVKKIIDSMKAKLETDRTGYTEFFTSLGSIIKEGIAIDFENRDKILDLLLFESSATKPGEYTTLDAYVSAMPEDQKDIFVLTGDSRAELEKSPYLEAVREKKYEVLFLTDPVDEWILPNMPQYKGKNFRSLTKGQLPEGSEDEKKEQEKQKEQFKSLVDWLGKRFEGKVKEVRLSSRLVTSPSCLVADEYDMGAHMEQLMKAMRQDVPKTKRILEINSGHQLVAKLHELVEANNQEDLAGELADALYANAVIAEGGKLEDPASFGDFFSKLLIEHANRS